MSVCVHARYKERVCLHNAHMSEGGVEVADIKATYLALPSGWRGKAEKKGEPRRKKGEIIRSWIFFSNPPLQSQSITQVP